MEGLGLERLRALLAVLDEGGFSRAARRLGQSQSSVSQAVLALERELGEPLVVRDGRRALPTAAGRVLAAHAERALAELRAARAELAALRDVTTGALAIGASDTLATYFLPPAFAAFRARHPGVELRLENRPSPVVAAQVASRALDLGVVTLPLGAGAEAALRVWPLARQRDVVITPPGHALARRRRVDFATLARHPLLLLDRSTATRAWLDAHFAAVGAAPRVAMEMSSVEVLKRLVELGFGLSVVPRMAAARELEQGTLAAPALAGAEPRRIAAITPTVGPLSPAVRAFLSVTSTSSVT